MLSVFTGVSAQLELYSDRLVIKYRAGLNYRISDTVIGLNDITALQVQRPSFNHPGHIKVIASGFTQAEVDVDKFDFSAPSYVPQNVILFHGTANYETALKFAKQFEQAKDALKQPSASAYSSIADELLKLKQLLDAGVLTEEEFAQQKSKLLGHSDYSEAQYSNESFNTQPSAQSNTFVYTDSNEDPYANTYIPIKPARRKGYFALFVFCIIGVVVMALASLSESELGVMGTIMYSIFAIIFNVLSKSPKSNKYILGRNHGITKKAFVLLCLLALFIITGISTSSVESNSEHADTAVSSQHTEAASEEQSSSIGKQAQSTAHTKSPTAQSTAKGISLSDIENWYNLNILFVEDNLVESANDIEGVSSTSVTFSKFHFGDDYGYPMCNYTIGFECSYYGVKHTGEARAFMEYGNLSPEWFHFEIFDNYGVNSPIEAYNDEYDTIIDEYYAYLVETYDN